MRPVDLIWLGQAASPPNWEMGAVHPADPTPAGLAGAVTEVVDGPAEGFVVVADPFEVPAPELVQDLLDRPVDVWHAGLSLGLAGRPSLLDLLRPTWMLNADAPPEVESTSWRLAPQICVVTSEVVRGLGGPDAGFEHLSGAGLDWGLRLIRNGAVLRHSPELGVPRGVVVTPPSPGDEARMLLRGWGRAWLLWVVLRLVRHGRFGAAARTARRLIDDDKAEVARPFVPDRPAPDLMSDEWQGRVSVLVPTLDRYDYLETLLSQLAAQTVRPKEVIVVDQTPPSSRRSVRMPGDPGFETAVITLDTVGQCTARNAGLGRATGDLVLFLDDDDEIPPDLIEGHVGVLVSRGADASCGGADEVGAGPPPPEFRLQRVSDVFPTNNTLLSVDALERSGLFDLQFDTGTMEDHDLGMRLYLTGALLVFDPSVRVLHHRAPSGGLRTHGQRVVTRARSRKSVVARRLPSATELYLYMRYFTEEELREHVALSVATTLRREGSIAQKALRVLVGLVLLPDTLVRVRRDRRRASALLEGGPLIPGQLRDEAVAG